MISTFILIAIFSHGHGPRVNYVSLGEFEGVKACQVAAAAISNAGDELNLMGHTKPKFVCARKN